MPVIFFKPISEHSSICVWKIEETEEELLNGLTLSPADEASIKGEKLAKRRIEKAACRQALAFLHGKDALEITYDSEGAPHIQGSNISFSHTRGFAAVAISSEKPIGIDIEPVSARISRLAKKFMNDTELQDTDTTDISTLHFFWGSKEAIIKLNGKKDIDFHQNITVTQTDKNSGTGNAIIGDTKKKILLTSWHIRNCLLVVARFQK